MRPTRVDLVAAARSSLQDGIERQLTPPTPPPRRNPPPSIDPSTGTLHSVQISSGKSASATTSIATYTNTSTATTSPSLGSSSNGTRSYATRGCCVDCAVWSNHGTIYTLILSVSLSLSSLFLFSLSLSSFLSISLYFLYEKVISSPIDRLKLR